MTSTTGEGSQHQSESVKRQALTLLDCLTSPRDPDDIEYDVEKDIIRRDNLLLENDYYELKLELRTRGLRTSGDKLEMITRLLLHIVDPTIKFDETSGLGANLKYIDESDLASKKVRRLSEEERQRLQDEEADGMDTGPDAEDLMVLRKKPLLRSSRRAPAMRGVNADQQPRVAETTIPGIPISSNNVVGSSSDSDASGSDSTS
eukprot:CAMPEP_0174965056 /NCGR_PEP_ID=MMETSP0004_2-20121128/6229_1 /TAXON_ID=420556 /ORGANISM="Ochromonas sp., Strain CCMP1393" /LENGTH=203 /DNA_ID=CAMNT_0016213861 /DNA_START=99 /DNA_END=706 /DNA_ORIENTATION=+